MKNTILITGANRGIGLEFTTQYLNSGWNVLACCRKPQQASDLIQLKSNYSQQLEIFSLDVSNEQQINDLGHQLKNVSIDILLNNAASYGPSQLRFGHITQQPWLDLFTTNTIAPLLLAQALIKNVAASERRIIANMSSLMASIADNDSGKAYYYRSSKTALNSAMKSLALDLLPQNICVVLLNPGWVKTDMGGPDALLTPTESVTKLVLILEQLTMEHTGSFINHDGSLLSW